MKSRIRNDSNACFWPVRDRPPTGAFRPIPFIRLYRTRISKGCFQCRIRQRPVEALFTTVRVAFSRGNSAE
jgi:hypothetical protein